MMPEQFLLSYVGFSADNVPIIDVQVGDTISRYPLLGHTLSLTFDLAVRYCTGWVDMAQHQAHPCPDNATVVDRYEQCLVCRNKTGFNPAFYHAKTISKQQETLNQNPHFVYLAYFAPELIKVGISQEARGIRRILEQGARAAIKLETFPSASIARQYEAKIAHLDGVVEHVIHSRKLALLSLPFDEVKASAELRDIQQRVEQTIGVTFESATAISTASHFNSADIGLEKLIVMKHEPTIIGTVRAVIGSDAICEHYGRLLTYNLKSYRGYRANTTTHAQLDLPSEQMTLF